jgi:putative membrane protein
MQNQLEVPVNYRGSYTDHLANERTFLAWIRTGLGLFALGCAIERFDVMHISNSDAIDSDKINKSKVSGLLLAICGIITLLFSIWRYYRINRQIEQNVLTTVAQIREPVIATFLLLLSMSAIVVIFI